MALKRPKGPSGTLIVVEHASQILKGNPLGDPHVRKLGSGCRRSTSGAAAAALKNTLADGRGLWLLGPHPEARSEHRLRMRGEGGLRTYVMDRVFRDANGMRWIVDFKTSRHEGAGLEEFLDEQRTRYEPQLKAYASAFDEARLGLYFPLLLGWREWTGGP